MDVAKHRSWEISRKLCESHADVSKPNKSTGDLQSLRRCDSDFFDSPSDVVEHLHL